MFKLKFFISTIIILILLIFTSIVKNQTRIIEKKLFKLNKIIVLKEKDIMVLYGGSVNSKNIKEILRAPYVDGVLIGGASLDAKKFTKICNLKI